jgi:phenylacetate-CoA ligase
VYARSLETLSRDALRAHQWQRLRAVADAALAGNPFLRRKWSAAGLASAADLAGWDDFGRLPFTEKAEFVADQAAHPCFGTNLTYPLERYVRVHQTSGTTGTPVRWLETQESWDWWARCWGFVLAGAGVTAADRVFVPFSFGLFIGFWAGFEGARALGALAIPGGGQDSVTRLGWMETLGATVLVCTPSYALHLIEVARERGIALEKLPVRLTIHAGEPGAGIAPTRARIEEGWGARAFDHAGMTEVGAYGYECQEQTGLHVNESEFIAEVIDPVTGAPAHEGELVLTNLGRLGSPAVRYRTGDRVRRDDGPCPCGRTFMKLAGGILGRLDDMLIVRGVNVFPSALEDIVRRFPGVDEFQVQVFRRDEQDELRICLDSPDGIDVSAVREVFRLGLGIRVEVVAVPPRSLPRYELKARRVVRLNEPPGPGRDESGRRATPWAGSGPSTPRGAGDGRESSRDRPAPG